MIPMRLCHFRPYRQGCGPTFMLTMNEAYRPLESYYGLRCERIAYRLSMREHGRTTVVFEGSYFRPSPLHAIDSDATVRALMGFLTLRPGDTDAEYFDDYTDTQRDYCAQHAEALSSCYWRGHMLTEYVR